MVALWLTVTLVAFALTATTGVTDTDWIADEAAACSASPSWCHMYCVSPVGFNDTDAEPPDDVVSDLAVAQAPVVDVRLSSFTVAPATPVDVALSFNVVAIDVAVP